MYCLYTHEKVDIFGWPVSDDVCVCLCRHSEPEWTVCV